MPKALKITKPARAHKSKKERAKKSTVRVINGGFVERSRKPELTGDEVQSKMCRVDGGFWTLIRNRAMKEGKSITEVTRDIAKKLKGR